MNGPERVPMVARMAVSPAAGRVPPSMLDLGYRATQSAEAGIASVAATRPGSAVSGDDAPRAGSRGLHGVEVAWLSEPWRTARASARAS